MEPITRRGVVATCVARVRVGDVMFDWIVALLVIALIAATLGFGGTAGIGMAIGQIIFVAALVGVAITFVMGMARRQR